MASHLTTNYRDNETVGPSPSQGRDPTSAAATQFSATLGGAPVLDRARRIALEQYSPDSNFYRCSY